MGTAAKSAGKMVSDKNGARRFPPEAYCYDDDVTTEAVESVRERAKKAMEDDEWESVDGFGRLFVA